MDEVGYLLPHVEGSVMMLPYYNCTSTPMTLVDLS